MQEANALEVGHVPLGIIGGSSLLSSSFFSNTDRRIIDTRDYGRVILYFGFYSNPERIGENKGNRKSIQNGSDGKYNFVFCQRHQSDPTKDYSPPHLINYKAIQMALKQVGVKFIIAFASVGSLNSEKYPFGTLLVADDFFNIWDIVTFFDCSRGHFIPNMKNDFRKEVVDLIKRETVRILQEKDDSSCLYGLRFIDGGVYVQTHGPRFETKAEVKFLKLVADVVGMTAAYEAILSGELKMQYSLICMVDNLANGILDEEPLTLEQFHEGVAKNQKIIETVLGLLFNQFIS